MKVHKQFIQLISIIIVILFLTTTIHSQPADRQLWLQYMDKVARPVLSNLAADKLKETMPVALSATIDDSTGRKKVSYLEAFGRTLSGIAPWLNAEGGSKEEIDLRNQYRQWALQAIGNAVDPAAKDYMQWNGGQPLVDASFLALGLVRCPWLWQHLDTSVQQQVITAFKTTRSTVPVYSNWLLFSGMIEAFFCKYRLAYDAVRIDYAVREFANHWYVGDGFFSDGMDFHMDYYNSIVIHPYLRSIVDIINGTNKRYQWFAPKLDTINKRYAEILERLINTDGSYPVIGRSIAYRCGVMHHLADASYRKDLPRSLSPAQVRSALTAVIKKTLNAPGTFNEKGWLNIGLYGTQPALGEFYITSGSLYLCADVFLPLGLSEEDTFWSAPAAPWTSVKVWSGQNVPADHAMDVH
ncbi:DUF2264 domain-containing protein [Ilyomonas limi]|uniref:DUF2264 domain-containing protein n=1 Tax=Ilyomonas limi TaxID=2575867 RepID=A0A4U3L6N5_9BACT|nr:DUF2264 domain-containing protein [Ilyomonas limi]TKK69287.1 DUF2264 domain-containing protein [Ilyomonas limi]